MSSYFFDTRVLMQSMLTVFFSRLPTKFIVRKMHLNREISQLSKRFSQKLCVTNIISNESQICIRNAYLHLSDVNVPDGEKKKQFFLSFIGNRWEIFYKFMIYADCPMTSQRKHESNKINCLYLDFPISKTLNNIS